MTMFSRRNHEVPGLNTASLPDLIFTVLFFFLIVTHMRDTQLKVKYTEPQGRELTKLAKKSAVIHIYIGTPEHAVAEGTGAAGGNSVIQLNDKYADIADIEDYIAAERERMAPEDLERLTVSIKADRRTKMSVISDVKQALRKAYALKIHYSGKIEEEK